MTEIEKKVPEPELLSDEEIKTWLQDLLLKRFAQTVELGGMCEDCCSAEDDKGDKAHVYCEMSERPLSEDDYCTQQVLVINSTIPEIIAKYQPLIASLKREIEELKTESKGYYDIQIELQKQRIDLNLEVTSLESQLKEARADERKKIGDWLEKSAERNEFKDATSTDFYWVPVYEIDIEQLKAGNSPGT